MLKTQEEVNKEFEKYVIKFPYSDTEELNDEHYYILKFIIKIRQDDREAILEMIKEVKTEKTTSFDACNKCDVSISTLFQDAEIAMANKIINKIKEI